MRIILGSWGLDWLLCDLDICKEIFARLCSDKAIDFTPSKIGSYWLNDKSGNTQIDVMAVDTVNKRLFAGECKYHNQPIARYSLKKPFHLQQLLLC